MCKCTDREKQFVKFEEYNDHEGETWYYFLQWDLNESNLIHLLNLLELVEMETGNEIEYRLELDELYPESEVDILVKHSPGGYNMMFNKVTGIMKPWVYNDLVKDYEYGPEITGLYKGRVVELFSETGE